MLQKYPLASVCHLHSTPVYIKQKVGESMPSTLSAIATQTHIIK